MTRALCAGIALAGIAAMAYASRDASGDAVPDNELSGGATTVFATGRNAFSFPAANLPDAERTRFAIGNSFFRRNWVEAPASTSARDGLGPHFIARSCGGCHLQDGRGAPPERKGKAHEVPVALLVRLSVAGADAHGGPLPEPTYGDQFANAAVQGVRREGDVAIRWQPVRGRFADGTPFTLQMPSYRLINLGYGPLAPGTMLSPRIAPQLIGVGLLEAIPEAEIMKNAADQAAAPGPVKGVVNRVHDVFTNTTMLGRFGWKANVATVAHQTGSAFVGDIGITSPRFPDEACTAAQKDCLAAPRGGWKGKPPEIDAKTFADVAFYSSTLGPPARRDVDHPQVRQGEALFAAAGCALCHRPSYVTGTPPLPQFSSSALSGQRIWPYTDLLLHDMGDALADGRPDFLASGRQWRTPPLWGVGLVKDVNGHTRLLHDGRARGVLEAILWHGGEAEDAKRKVLAMPKKDREALVKFVESL